MKIRSRSVKQSVVLFSSFCLLIAVLIEKDTIITLYQSKMHQFIAEQYLKDDEMLLDNKKFYKKECYIDEENSVCQKEDKGNERQRDYTGTVDCVLEIPSIDLINLVLAGGNQQDNLSKHYLVTAQEDIQYGKSSYIVCGHHSFLYGVALNRLHELSIGDLIYVIQNGKRDIFEVTEIIEEQWGMDVSDFTSDIDKLAIYTCKAQKERPKPYLVVRAIRVKQKN